MQLGTDAMLKQDGTSVNTVWGEIAYQLDPKAYRRHVQSSDDRGEAPGNAVFREVLVAASPCLILIDELTSYLEKLRYSNSRRSQNLYRQSVQFFHELLQEVGNIPGVVVLLSLPKSQQEFGGIDPAELARQLGIVDELRARADRVVAKRTPVSDTEVYTLLSRRLFKPSDADKVNRVVDAYYEVYDRGRGEGLYDAGIYTSDYRRQMVESYPLHPELVDVLYKKWGAQGDFPRTRTVLQLLANVVADLWVNKRAQYLIQSAHVDLARERVRTKVLSAMGAGVANESVVAADIIGGDAHADGFDERRQSAYREHRIARGVATTILLHSSGGQMRRGASPAEIRLGTVSPKIGPEYVKEVTDNLEETLWFVHADGQLLRFEPRQNLYRRIAETANNQPSHQVEERMKEAMAQAFGTAAGFKVLQWAATDGSIDDKAEPTVAVLAALPRYRMTADGAAPADSKAIEELWNRSGGGLRQWRNALVLVAADEELWKRAEQAMREVMAYESVLSGPGANDLSEAERKDLASRRKDKEQSLRTSLVTAWKWLFYPEGEGELKAVALPAATAGETIAGRAVERLESHDYGQPKVLRNMSAMYFDAKIAARLWKPDEELDLAELARRFPAWTYLPILPDRLGTLRACIAEGIAKDMWSAVYGDKATTTYRTLIETKADFDSVPDVFDGATFLARGELRALIREELRPKVEAGPEDPRRGGEPGGGGETEKGGGEEPPKRKPGDREELPVAKRYTRVRVRFSDLPVTKTTNLQPYLWKVFQNLDAAARIDLSATIQCPAGVSEEVLTKQIVEGFEMLGIAVEWEPA